MSRFTIQSGWLTRTASSGHSTGSDPETLRRTALQRPFSFFGADSTVAPTAAWGGVSRNASWKAPRRSHARAVASTRPGSGRKRSTSQSHERCIRVVP